MNWLKTHPRTIFLAVGVLVLAGIAYDLSDRASKNKQAIKESCTLLNNAIIKSLTASSQPGSAGAILVNEILRTAPTDVQKQYQVAAQGGGSIKTLLVDCDEVADHPKNIKAEELPTP